jgi:hypothetical protein
MLPHTFETLSLIREYWEEIDGDGGDDSVLYFYRANSIGTAANYRVSTDK